MTEAVKSITWKGGAVKPGEFLQFRVSVGLPDDASSLEFKALQTYSDGSVVRWIEDPPAAGQAEPEHPAPILTLTTGTDSGSGGAGATPATLPKDVASTSSVDSAKTLAVVGIVVGAVGLVAGAVGLLTRRRA